MEIFCLPGGDGWKRKIMCVKFVMKNMRAKGEKLEEDMFNKG